MNTTVMRDAYQAANALKYFFDSDTPIDLWRGQKSKDHKSGEFILQPITEQIVLIVAGKKRIRLPDVKVFTKNGEAWIKGCRTTKQGNQHWGVSLFDKQPNFAANGMWLNFKIPQGTPIPQGLAVTQDSDMPDKENHYTISPKDDMPLALFIQHLKSIANHIQTW